MSQPSQRRKRKPSWFNLRLDEYTEWAKIRVPEQHAEDCLGGAVAMMDTPMWGELFAVQDPLRALIIERDWVRVSPWHLVAALQIIGDVHFGINKFLPPPYATKLDPEVRQALYLCIFLIHGAPAIEDNPDEDFGLPELAHLPPSSRAIIAATKPLAYLMIRPVVIELIRRWREEHRHEMNAALFTLLHHAQERAEQTWLPMLGVSPAELIEAVATIPEITKADGRFAKHTRFTSVGDATGAFSEVLIEATSKRDVAETLARGLVGETDDLIELVASHLRKLHEETRKFDRHRTTIRVKVRDKGVYAKTENIILQHRDERPTPEDACIHEEVADDPVIRDILRVRALKDDPTLDRKLRMFLTAFLQNPHQGLDTIAKRIGKSEKTVANYFARVHKLLARP